MSGNEDSCECDAAAVHERLVVFFDSRPSPAACRAAYDELVSCPACRARFFREAALRARMRAVSRAEPAPARLRVTITRRLRGAARGH